mmetsp:Transcript_69581/g.136598  ORF Transcript_69581/g.136598 Transcript_69581/m.136598 type:complete len:147 (-) Transcript_69581:13-453(-)
MAGIRHPPPVNVLTNTVMPSTSGKHMKTANPSFDRIGTAKGRGMSGFAKRNFMKAANSSNVPITEKQLSTMTMDMKSNDTKKTMIATWKQMANHGVPKRLWRRAKILGNIPTSAMPASCQESSNNSAEYCPKFDTNAATTIHLAIQ